MWLFKQKPGLTSLTFLTPTGELLLSTKEANKYMESHGVKHVIDAKLCQSRLGTNYELELKKIEKKVKVKTEADNSFKIEGDESFKIEGDTSFRMEVDTSFKMENETSFKVPSGIKIEKCKYYLVNLNADPSLNEMLVYYLKVTYNIIRLK